MSVHVIVYLYPFSLVRHLGSLDNNLAILHDTIAVSFMCDATSVVPKKDEDNEGWRIM
jgi:hypothetical protein